MYLCITIIFVNGFKYENNVSLILDYYGDGPFVFWGEGSTSLYFQINFIFIIIFIYYF